MWSKAICQDVFRWWLADKYFIAGSVSALHSDGTPVSQAQVAIHAKDSEPILAMALGQTMYLAQFDKSDTDTPASVWDCTDASKPTTSIQLSHSLRYLAFSPSRDKLAAVDSTDQVGLAALTSHICKLDKWTTCEQNVTSFLCYVQLLELALQSLKMFATSTE